MPQSEQNLPTQEYLNSIFRYDPETGLLYWKVRPCKRMESGARAGCLTSNGYISVKINCKMYMAHRVIWCLLNGLFPIGDIDHIDHCRQNNREENLRSVTRQENLRNQLISPKNTSGTTGVGWHKPSRRWRSYISVNNKLIHLGYFKDKFEAIKARAEANIEYGFHPNHGGSK
jgi:hypothetical protein